MNEYNENIAESVGFLFWSLKSSSTRENLASGFASNKGADQPAHPRSLVRAFVIRSLNVKSKRATS